LKPHWYYILLSLASGHRHGLAIARDVSDLSSGRTRLWPASLYGSLGELCDLGWIQEIAAGSRRPDDSERKRFYGITAAGRRELDAETTRLAALVKHARGVRKRRTV
jgi:DNA-binding PadR family transcriptional regulator